MTPWWSDVAAGWIGGIAGGGLGMLAGVYGAAAGCLAPRGKCRTLILSVHAALMVLGFASLIAGVTALLSKQPYHVWYPLTLIGFIMTLVLGCLLPVVRLRYRQAEARKLDAKMIRGA